MLSFYLEYKLPAGPNLMQRIIRINRVIYVYVNKAQTCDTIKDSKLPPPPPTFEGENSKKSRKAQLANTPLSSPLLFHPLLRSSIAIPPIHVATTISIK